MKHLCVLLLCVLLGGCASVQYTVDDGRAVDEVLLANIRAYGHGEQRIRPAIVRSAALSDPDCSRQWDLSFAVATSANWSETERVAWVRGLGVDERLTVIATSPRSQLHLGDKLIQVDGERHEDSAKLLAVLADRRDRGAPFDVMLLGGRRVRVTPFQVCRGYARLAPPNTPQMQDYHWLMSVHSLQVTDVETSEDEALWIVLWSQGLSEEGGARMKTFDYGVKIAGTLYNLATLVSGLKGAALAAEAAMSAAKSAAANVAAEVVRAQLIEQARELAARKLREAVSEAVQSATRAQLVRAMEAAAVNRGTLSGVARVAATVFDRADLWAYQRIGKLHGSPLAGFSLHRKLAGRDLTRNAFVLDLERLDALKGLALSHGTDASILTAALGISTEDLPLPADAMPLASTPSAFSFEGPVDARPGEPTRGLVESLLEMPATAGARP